MIRLVKVTNICALSYINDQLLFIFVPYLVLFYLLLQEHSHRSCLAFFQLLIPVDKEFLKCVISRSEKKDLIQFSSIAHSRVKQIDLLKRLLQGHYWCLCKTACVFKLGITQPQCSKEETISIFMRFECLHQGFSVFWLRSKCLVCCQHIQF